MNKPWELGLYCNAWTVNSMEDAKDPAARGTTGIITDTPAEIIAALAY